MSPNRGVAKQVQEALKEVGVEKVPNIHELNAPSLRAFAFCANAKPKQVGEFLLAAPRPSGYVRAIAKLGLAASYLSASKLYESKGMPQDAKNMRLMSRIHEEKIPDWLRSLVG